MRVISNVECIHKAEKDFINFDLELNSWLMTFDVRNHYPRIAYVKSIQLLFRQLPRDIFHVWVEGRHLIRSNQLEHSSRAISILNFVLSSFWWEHLQVVWKNFFFSSLLTPSLAIASIPPQSSLKNFYIDRVEFSCMAVLDCCLYCHHSTLEILSKQSFGMMLVNFWHKIPVALKTFDDL